jgi:predicted dehydrogenase
VLEAESPGDAPSAFHADFTIRAFAAGKHVLCEKPMALSSAECAAMIAAGRRANRKLMIAYRSHFEPYNVEAMRLMRERAVGDIRLIRSEQSYRAGPTTPAQNWRMNRALAGGGPLEDFGIYGLQSALYLTGGEMGLRDLRLIEAIYAAARTGRTVKLAPDGRIRG